MAYYIVMKYRDTKIPIQERSHESPQFAEFDKALATALQVTKEDPSALVLVETDKGRIAAAFIWGDRVLPYLHQTEPIVA